MLPANPEQRQIVICVEQLSSIVASKISLPNPFTTGITLHKREHLLKNKIGAVFKKSAVRDGAIFIQSPYDFLSYVTLPDSQHAFALTKASRISEFCRILGAKRIVVEATEQIDTESALRGKGKILTPTAVGEVDWKRDQIAKVRSGMTLDDKSDGSRKPDLDRALSFLQEHHLTNETPLTDLLSSMRNRRNPLMERTLSTNLLRETSDLIEVGVKATFNGCLTSVGASFSSAKKRMFRFDYKIKVSFP